MTVSFVTLNLFIAIILQAFDPEQEQDETHTKDKISDDMIAEFVDSWSYFDPMATGYMNYSSFEHFLQKIRHPMGIGQAGTRVQMFKILHTCEIIRDTNVQNIANVRPSNNANVRAR